MLDYDRLGAARCPGRLARTLRHTVPDRVIWGPPLDVNRSRLIKQFPNGYGPRRFITVLSRTRQWTSSSPPPQTLSISNLFFFLVSLSGVRLSPLGTSATVGLLYQPRMIDDDYGAVGGIRNGRGNRSTRRKPAPVPLCPSQTPYDLT
jgi:hypothetical protein